MYSIKKQKEVIYNKEVPISKSKPLANWSPLYSPPISRKMNLEPPTLPILGKSPPPHSLPLWREVGCFPPLGCTNASTWLLVEKLILNYISLYQTINLYDSKKYQSIVRLQHWIVQSNISVPKRKLESPL